MASLKKAAKKSQSTPTTESTRGRIRNENGTFSSSSAIARKQCAKKSAYHSNPLDTSCSARVRVTTESLYSSPGFSKFLTANSIYRYMRTYWNTNGKPFLQRTLWYEKSIYSSKKRQTRKRTGNSEHSYARPTKRIKLESGDDGLPLARLYNGHSSQKHGDIERKSLLKKVLFEAIFDRSGISDTVDLDVALVKTTMHDVVEDIAIENGHVKPHVTLRVCRNPPENATGINGHTFPSIPVTIDRESPQHSNGHQPRPKIWLICRCKSALPRTTGRQGLRNSVQRRANASLAPLMQDYCYGYCLVGGSDHWNMLHQDKYIEIFMKRLYSNDDSDDGANSRVSNGHAFSPLIFSDLIKSDEMSNVIDYRCPILRIWVGFVGTQRRRCTNQDHSLPTKGDRVLFICDKLPKNTDCTMTDDRNLMEFKKEWTLTSPSSTEDSQDNGLLLYQFCVEHQQAGNSMGVFQSRFTTKHRNVNRCPFCETKCTDLYALLKHHRLSHPRWSFTLKDNNDGYVIDVRPNVSYDGRMEVVVVRKRLSRRKVIPIKRRAPCTMVIYCRQISNIRHTCTSRSLEEFKSSFKHAEWTEAQVQREFMLNHVRRYYHSQTCQVVLPSEFEKDSDDEIDPEWLRNRTQRLIDDFTDVNNGEKSLMKLWNLHIMKHNYIGDRQMAAANDSFLKYYGPRLVLENLTRNFLVHLANLYHFGVLSQADVHRLTQQLYEIKALTVSSNSGRSMAD